VIGGEPVRLFRVLLPSESYDELFIDNDCSSALFDELSTGIGYRCCRVHEKDTAHCRHRFSSIIIINNNNDILERRDRLRGESRVLRRIERTSGRASDGDRHRTANNRSCMLQLECNWSTFARAWNVQLSISSIDLPSRTNYNDRIRSTSNATMHVDKQQTSHITRAQHTTRGRSVRSTRALVSNRDLFTRASRTRVVTRCSFRFFSFLYQTLSSSGRSD
jgi:hypothetical protein